MNHQANTDSSSSSLVGADGLTEAEPTPVAKLLRQTERALASERAITRRLREHVGQVVLLLERIPGWPEDDWQGLKYIAMQDAAELLALLRDTTQEGK